MNFRRNLAFAAVPVALALLAGCQSGGQTEPAPEQAAGLCRADGAAALAGRDRMTDTQLMAATGAASVRQITPGSPVTMDYRAERVTVETDPASGRIVEARCG